MCQLNSNQHIIISKRSDKQMRKDFKKQFDDLMKVVSNDCLYKRIILASQKKYLVKHLGLLTLNPSLVSKLINRNYQKTNLLRISSESSGQQMNQTFWALNQFKIFSWVSVCYSFIINQQIQNYNLDNYLFLQSLFERKSLEFIQYHLSTFLKDLKDSRMKWNREEDTLLSQIIKNKGESLIWSEISFDLFKKSEKLYFRSPQKCRERWLNHLNTEVNREKWTIKEDLQLFNYITKYGPKWALISKMFKGTRTEHMTKNRYNSFVKRYQNRAQRTSIKKIVEKIHSDLIIKISESLVKREEMSQDIDIICEELSVQNSNNQMISKTEEAEKETREVEVTKGTKRLNSFDLEEILFNESIKIENPYDIGKQVKLMEIQIYENLPKVDEYINTLLF